VIAKQYRRDPRRRHHRQLVRRPAGVRCPPRRTARRCLHARGRVVPLADAHTRFNGAGAVPERRRAAEHSEGVRNHLPRRPARRRLDRRL